MSHNNLMKSCLPMTPTLGLGLSLLLICSMAYALPEDRSLPIQIDANRAVLSNREGTTIYIGDVILVQGTLIMHADRVEIYTINKEVDRVIAFGKPAKVEDKPDPEKAVVKARAETIRYFMKKEKLELETNAYIDQDGAQITSDSIHYFINDQVVEANSKQQEGRVKMVIPPRTEQP
jgi:lipopolysaccharide export system protein LptA